MGVPRSNSPSTVSPVEVEKVVEKVPPNQYKVASKDEKLQMSSDESEEVDPTDDTKYLKDELTALIAKSNGCTKDEKIGDIISALSERNPHKEGSLLLDVLPGDYLILTIPHYPGRIKTEDPSVCQYTLGRLSFDIFQPNELVCTVKTMRNPVHLQHDVTKVPKWMDDGKAAIYSYHIICELIIHTPDGDLEATLINEGFCRKSDDKTKPTRMKVTFVGGTLVPSADTCDSEKSLTLWKNTFANAYAIANKKRSILGWVLLYCLKLFLGLVLPTDFKNSGSSRSENAFRFEINRAPHGFFDVLYLDDEMRISKGNRGTITIAKSL